MIATRRVSGLFVKQRSAQKRRKSHDDKGSEAIRRQFRDTRQSPDDRSVEQKHREGTDEAGFFGEIVFSTVVPRDVAVAEAPSHAASVLDYAPRSRGARAYIELCMEVLERE